ncbi:LysR family transcriptional regulator [Cognatishimia sp. SS12]|uniref:LysR family transcriptional regulator n=1 Tax=Cognatishimia sp. SS12 TaxID=2979465 RepID=UPI0023310EEA|nr:LysR family transcriptional regulator [Cognatishimia sp. SS12]MDC0738620.1 LysR family transcriptional regulator [Cognatishimia sp. SS12]
MRNLDVTTLRSFMTVADLGGVTKAAGFLNLTQSAVSMQLKRLEEMLGVNLLDRSGRTVALTAEGEQLLGYARRMVSLNDEVVRRLTHDDFEGRLRLGVPHDIVYPAIPHVLQQFSRAFPRVKVSLNFSFTSALKDEFSRGEFDIILTTEASPTAESEVLCETPLVWVGAIGGASWRRRPLRFASCQNCLFRPGTLAALDQVGIEWEPALDSSSDRAVEATVSADLAVMSMLEGTEPPHLEVVQHNGALPDLGFQHINMYGAERDTSEARSAMADMLRQAFCTLMPRHDRLDRRAEAPRLASIS